MGRSLKTTKFGACPTYEKYTNHDYYGRLFNRCLVLKKIQNFLEVFKAEVKREKI